MNKFEYIQQKSEDKQFAEYLAEDQNGLSNYAFIRTAIEAYNVARTVRKLKEMTGGKAWMVLTGNIAKENGVTEQGIKATNQLIVGFQESTIYFVPANAYKPGFTEEAEKNIHEVTQRMLGIDSTSMELNFINIKSWSDQIENGLKERGQGIGAEYVKAQISSDFQISNSWFTER